MLLSGVQGATWCTGRALESAEPFSTLASQHQTVTTNVFNKIFGVPLPLARSHEALLSSSLPGAYLPDSDECNPFDPPAQPRALAPPVPSPQPAMFTIHLLCNSLGQRQTSEDRSTHKYVHIPAYFSYLPHLPASLTPLTSVLNRR